VTTSKKLVITLSIALAFFGLLGCGTSNHLQTITLTSGSSSGTFNIVGIGGTLQLKAIGNYSSTKTHDLSNVATYAVTPVGQDIDGNALAAPPQTMTINPTGMATAVDPAVCTWINLQPDPTKSPAWALTGSYQVIATYQGVSSQPVFIAIASAAGPAPTGLCGPS
jgi:hypothetical protein